MAFKISKYANKVYDKDKYNCLHFAIEAYQDITGSDVNLFVTDIFKDLDLRTVNVSRLKEFKEIKAPVEPCVAVMYSNIVHAGVYHQGKIIHLSEHGPQCVPPHLAEIKHGRIKYYVLR